MADSANSDQTAFKKYFDPDLHYWQRHFRRYQYFRTHEETHSFRRTTPAEMVCVGEQETLLFFFCFFFLKDGLKVAPYSMHP